MGSTALLMVQHLTGAVIKDSVEDRRLIRARAYMVTTETGEESAFLEDAALKRGTVSGPHAVHHARRARGT